MIFGKHINRYYLRYSGVLLLGILALLVVDYLQLKVPEFYKLIINGINNGAVELRGETVPFTFDLLLDEVCLPMIFVILLMVAGRFAWRICFFGSAIRVERDIRSRMFDKCKVLSQEYYQRNKVGNLMSLFTNDLETVQDCFGSGVLMMFDALLLGVLAFIKMWRLDRMLTLFAMLPMILLLAAGILVGRFMTSKWEKRQEAFSSLSDFSQENFSGISVVKAFVREAYELSRFRRLNRENENANVAYTKASTMLNIIVILFVESVICIILGYGGYLVYTDVFNAGELLEFVGYFTSIVWPIMAVAQLIEMSSRGKASLSRVSELLEAPVTVIDAEGVEELAEPRGGISFKNLTFRYPDSERDVLINVSFDILPGENVGIIGRTGSGKTTIVDLILRTYNVPEGTLFIDGRDVSTVSISSVRRAAAYVPQDNFLFSDTIARNISFAVDEDDPLVIEAAARLSDVHENIIGFPEGYATVLGERGVTVSGGQKQRISIARAFLKDAPILILDDSVSAVDTKTERIILDNLRTSREGKTTILIAHRISTVERMDKIIFLDEGRVVDVGSHDELLARCRAYRTMVELQRLEDEGGND